MTERKDYTAAITYTQDFDVENRLITVTQSITTTTTVFDYDDTGQRTKTDVITPGSKRTITFYPFPNYEKEVRSSWQYTIKGWSWVSYATITRKTYSAGGQAIATRVSGDPETANNGLFYFHSDHLGSATFLTHGNGHANEGLKVANSTKFFTPFGEYRIEPPSPVDGITDRGYTGHKHDDGIGLIYMNARYYVGAIGRFASADSLIPYPNDPQSHNRYSYVRNNALNSIDPTGHIDCIDPEEPCVPAIAPQADPFPVCLEVYCDGVLPLDAGVTVDGPIQNNVSLGRKIFATSLQINGIFLDIIELNASLIGIGGQPLAALAGTPIGASVIAWLVERFGADFAETLLSNVTLLNTIIADIVAGYSYIDKDTNELVVGQSTILGMIEMGLDGLVPASPEFDLFLNSFMLIYDIVDLLGAPNIIEYRIPIYSLPQPRLFFGKGYFVIYDFE